MTKVYVAIDVGCIECGESTTLVGLYATASAARDALKAVAAAHGEEYDEYGGGYFNGGQHDLELFEADLPE